MAKLTLKRDAEPLPCFLCGKLPIVNSFALMTGKLAWTCLCPTKCYETSAYYERDHAVEAWNNWTDSEGFTDYELEFDDWEEDDG